MEVAKAMEMPAARALGVSKGQSHSPEDKRGVTWGPCLEHPLLLNAPATRIPEAQAFQHNTMEAKTIALQEVMYKTIFGLTLNSVPSLISYHFPPYFKHLSLALGPGLTVFLTTIWPLHLLFT